jgi:hypothetical protein
MAERRQRPHNARLRAALDSLRWDDAPILAALALLETLEGLHQLGRMCVMTDFEKYSGRELPPRPGRSPGCSSDRSTWRPAFGDDPLLPRDVGARRDRL